jgi:hypothetical protein
MLNLAFMFDDANRAFTGYAERLTVGPLPATLYLMQQDVINHYHYALDHYFTLTLREHYLQNSSIGTPYQKWAKFTNEDFGLLSFTIHNLLRYTSRLVHETECAALIDTARHSEMASRSNRYTSLLCEIKYWGKRVGVSVEDNNRLLVAAARLDPGDAKLTVRCNRAGTPEYFRVRCDTEGLQHEEAISEEEYDQEYKRLMPQIRPSVIDIGNRSVLSDLREQGKLEVAELTAQSQMFAEACKTFYREHAVVEPFSNLNQSYWV